MIKRYAHAFLVWFCHPEYYPDIAGDLEELYLRRASAQPQQAQWRYLLQVLGLFRPSLMKNFGQNSIISPVMIRNYLKIGFRHLVRQKLFTIVNVLGLALGLSAFLLMQAYLTFERSYEHHLDNLENKYRVSTVMLSGGQDDVFDAMTCRLAAGTLEEEILEVEVASASRYLPPMPFRKGETPVIEEKVVWADANFLKIFNYPILMGSPTGQLEKPNEVVLTQSKAKAYFGDEPPIGKTILWLRNGGTPLTVTGVIQDPPQSTHYKFDMLVSDPTFKYRRDYDTWNFNNHYVYLTLSPNASVEKVQAQLDQLITKYQGEDFQERWQMVPMEGIHLNTDWTYEAETPGNPQALQIVQIISIFILIIAWVNYINLTTARAVDRAKEVGLRKVIGALRGQLIGQFFFEALLVNAVAAILALFLAELSLPFFNNLVGQELYIHTWTNPKFLRQLFLFFGVGTLITGAYPALVLSGFTPAVVLKGKFRNSARGILLRKGLVVVQFATSLVLIAGTFLVLEQMRFIRTQDIGIDTNYVVGFNRPQLDPNAVQEGIAAFQAMKDEMRNHTSIETVGGVNSLPGGNNADIGSTTNEIRIVGITDFIESTTYLNGQDDHFVDAMDMELVAGRGFDFDKFGDTASMLVNEAFVSRYNLDDPLSILNEMLQFGDSEDADLFKVVGILKDFHRTSLKEAVEPTLYYPSQYPNYLVVELLPERYQEGLDYIEARWANYFPDSPLELTFLDDRFEALYVQDKRFGKVVGTFASLAIVIASLGLLGLAAFVAIQKTKEVGVRKVLGASLVQILAIFYREFLVLIGIALIIGVPAYFWAMNAWLSNYAFHIPFPWHMMLYALGIVVAFVLLTVGAQTFRVATMKPAITLRYE